MAIKIEMLRCFVTVAQTGNLAEAAQRLGRTQSALSMTLKQFEENVGARLFESDRKNRLTALGAQIFELSQAQIRQFDNTVKTIETCARSPEGLIRIASIPSVAAQVFPAVIGEMTRHYPGLSIELRDTDTAQVIDALMRGHADIGIASGRHALNGIRQTPLFSDAYGLLCAPDHPLMARAEALTLADVVGSAFIHNNLLSLIETEALQAAVTGAAVSVHNTMSLVAMVRTGEWVTILPQSVVAFMSPDLAFRPISDLPDQRQVSLLMRDKAPFPEQAEALWQLLMEFDWE